ncbi:hypothetical protein Dimus_010904 [Dionaea muscipula]
MAVAAPFLPPKPLLLSPSTLFPGHTWRLPLLPTVKANPFHLHHHHHHHHHHQNQFRIPIIPLLSSFRNGSTPPETECPVPLDQQPINEYQNLSTSLPFSWASDEASQYTTRLFVTGLSFALLLGLPVSWVGATGSVPDPLRLVLGSASTGLFVVTLAVVRMYLGWAYVGNRLLSATVEYEETGWYDGQVWVKTAEVLVRDRLLGSYQVKPVLSRLKNTLVVLALALFMCIVLLDYEAKQDVSYKLLNEARDRVVAGVYNDDSARSFEPDAFCGEPSVP